MTAQRTVPPPEPAWAFFLDIDGTLVDFAPSPDGIAIHPALPDAIARIAGLSGGALALITGRSIPDVDRLFPHLRLPVAGQHGLERRSASGALAHPTRESFSARRSRRTTA